MSQYIVHFTSSFNSDHALPAGKPSFTIRQYEVNGPKDADSMESLPEPNLDGSTNIPKTSILLYGRGMPNYGEDLQEDLLHVMESFWNYSPPVNPTGGQLWFDATTDALRVYKQDLITPANSQWVNVHAIFADNNPPVDIIVDGNLIVGSKYKILSTGSSDFTLVGAGINTPGTSFIATGVSGGGNGIVYASPRIPVEGELWYDTSVPQLKIYDSVAATWIDVALSLSGGTMNSGANITMNGGEVLGLPAIPSGDDASASKKYVDDEVSGVAGDLVTHEANLNLHLTTHQNTLLDNIETLFNGLDAVELGALDGFRTWDGTVQVQIDGKLSLTGGLMSGIIDMGNNEILQLSIPTTANSATPKNYVDIGDQILYHDAVSPGWSSSPTSGFQVVSFGGAITSLSDPTGLTNDPTVYTATITVDGTPIAVSVVGQDAQDFTNLLVEINNDIVGFGSASVVGGDIVITSDTTGITSTVSISNVDLFSSLTGFVGFLPPVGTLHLFTLPFNFDVTSNRLFVYINGIKWTVDEGYAETAINEITWLDDIPAGAKAEFFVMGKVQ